MNKPNHAACTVDALNVFTSLQEITIKDKEIANPLSLYPKKEDGWARRPFHQLFFNNRNHIGSSSIPGARTSEKRVTDLIDQFDQSLKGYKSHSKFETPAYRKFLEEFTEVINLRQTVSDGAESPKAIISAIKFYEKLTCENPVNFLFVSKIVVS